MDPSYNNSFNAPQPVVSSGGDIVLSSQPKKDRKKLVIAIIIVACILVGVGVFILVNFMSKNSTSLSEYGNQYFNLITTGEKNKIWTDGEVNIDTLKESESSNIYNISESGDPLSDENKTYYSELHSILSNINKLAHKLTNEENKNTLEYLADDSSKLLSLYSAGMALVYTNASYDYYIENGSLDGFLDQINYNINDTEDNLINDFKYIVDLTYEKEEEYFRAVNNSGCLVANTIDYECEAGSQLAVSARREMQDAQGTLADYADKMLNLIIVQANEIKTLTADGGNNE